MKKLATVLMLIAAIAPMIVRSGFAQEEMSKKKRPHCSAKALSCGPSTALNVIVRGRRATMLRISGISC